eukprot:1607501-Rhodomonas_salina.1
MLCKWKISENTTMPFSSDYYPPARARKLWLECMPVPPPGNEGLSERGESTLSPTHPMHFSLQDDSGTISSLVLLPGNASDSSQKQAEWGSWTLVRRHKSADNEVPENRGDEPLVLIDLAGPVVVAWAAEEVSVALALANAMFWSCMQHVPSQLELQRKMQSVVSRKCASSSCGGRLGCFKHGQGFFVLVEEDTDVKDSNVRETGTTETRGH